MRALRSTPLPGPARAPRSADAGPAADTSAVSQAVPGTVGGPRIYAPFRGPLALFLASLALIAAGAVLLGNAGVRTSPGAGNATASAANQALTNPGRTRQVTAAVSAGVAGIYSYSYTDLAATRAAARAVLAGPAAAQYTELSGMLSDAVTERLVVTTRVTDIGVRSLTGDTATLLVFLEQATTRDGKPAGRVPAQLQVTARLAGGRWVITGITAR
ncbi:MAG: hypothetical protein ACRDN0_34610 [Trebonia sp.]